MRRYARAIAGHPSDAEDLCQLALERALKAQAQLLDGTRMDAWLYRIMRNCWIDELRSRKRQVEVVAFEDAGAERGELDPAFEALNLRQSFDHGLRALPEEQKEAIVLVVIEGLSYRDAAEILDIPMGTLTSRLVRGRQALGKMLEVE
jgi:RNA polymerase sigma-70 factor (ECF subfamily)